MQNNAQVRPEIGIKWIKSSTGRTFLCSAGALDGISNPTEEQLISICVDESENPQND